MAPKSALVEFRHCLLKRPHEGDGGDNSGLASFKEPKISQTLRSFALEAPFPNKHKSKKAGKAKEVIQLDFDVPPTSEAKLELNILAKNFPYP